MATADQMSLLQSSAESTAKIDRDVIGKPNELHQQFGFVLNQKVSLKKKLEACKRDDVSMKPYEGGVIMEFSTVFYEALKAAMNTFYDASAENLDLVPKWRRDVDLKQQKHRDVLSVKTLDGEHEYTVQMFHTTTSLQVNGKHYDRFITRDLIKVRGIVQHYIEASGYKTSDLNIQLAEVLKSALTEDSFLKSNQAEHEPGNDKEMLAIGKVVEDKSASENKSDSNDTFAPESSGPGAISKNRHGRKPDKKKSNTLHCLQKGCKYNRQDRNNISMIQCGSCFVNYHYPCTGDDEEILQECVLFTCRDCRTMPARVYSIMVDLEEVKQNVSQLPTSTQTVEQLKGRCNQLTSEIQKLKSMVEKLQKTVESLQGIKGQEYPPLPKSKPIESKYSEAIKGKSSSSENDKKDEPEDRSIINQSILSIEMTDYENSEDDHSSQDTESEDDWSVVSRKHKKTKQKRKAENGERKDNDKKKDPTYKRKKEDVIKMKSRYKTPIDHAYHRKDGREYSRYSLDDWRTPKKWNSNGWYRPTYRSRNNSRKSPRHVREADRNSWNSMQYSHWIDYDQEYQNRYCNSSHSHIRDNEYQDYNKSQKACLHCGERNHETSQCWYERPIRCNVCRSYGHKSKSCKSYY